MLSLKLSTDLKLGTNNGRDKTPVLIVCSSASFPLPSLPSSSSREVVMLIVLVGVHVV